MLAPINLALLALPFALRGPWSRASTPMASVSFADRMEAVALASGDNLESPEAALMYLSGAGARNALMAEGVSPDTIREAQAALVEQITEKFVTGEYTAVGFDHLLTEPKVAATHTAVTFVDKMEAAASASGNNLDSPEAALMYLSGAGARSTLMAEGVSLDTIRRAQAALVEQIAEMFATGEYTAAEPLSTPSAAPVAAPAITPMVAETIVEESSVEEPVAETFVAEIAVEEIAVEETAVEEPEAAAGKRKDSLPEWKLRLLAAEPFVAEIAAEETVVEEPEAAAAKSKDSLPEWKLKLLAALAEPV
jgi:hypothetical protein